AAAKRILRYIRGTMDYGILFPNTDKGNQCELIAYTDSNWCGDANDRKSTAGIIVCMPSHLASKSNGRNDRSKHIEMRFHYLREQVNNGKLCLKHCRSGEQLADILTKAVQIEVYKRLRNMMGLESLATLN
ncbi:copia protein, partial [Trifolium pratense]